MRAVSSFQTYLDNAERQTGITPREFIRLAEDKGLASAKVGEIVAWLKADHGLGHGHANGIAQLISKGPDAIAEKYGEDGVLHIDGLDAR